MRPTVLLVAGARPNFMKIAPIVRAVRADGRLEAVLVHTGQHYDREMSELFFEQLGIPEPDVRLDVGSGSHAQQTAKIMLRIEQVVQERLPAAVVVVGDVNSTIASALVAVKLGVPVAHVEAGLRSFDRSMPEEINRVLTDAIAEWLFVSERSGMDNLSREGVDPRRMHFVGNVMIDTLLAFRERAVRLGTPGTLGVEPRGYAVLTLHRPANVDAARRLLGMLDPIRELGRALPVLFPVHPRTRATLREIGFENVDGVRLLEPLGYLEFVDLMAHARLVITDSGGIQEETTVLRVPCVTLRDNTERPVTIEQGTNRLGGTRRESIRLAIRESLEADEDGVVTPEGWDGNAADRVVERLAGDLSGKGR